jgi:plasmid stabilization system protein ParE
MKRLTLRLEAQLELSEAALWYELEKEGLGTRFENEVNRVLVRVERAPLQFPEVEPGIRRALLNRFPYGIFFTEGPDEIEVLAVFHLHREPGGWRNRK